MIQLTLAGGIAGVGLALIITGLFALAIVMGVIAYFIYLLTDINDWPRDYFGRLRWGQLLAGLFAGVAMTFVGVFVIGIVVGEVGCLIYEDCWSFFDYRPVNAEVQVPLGHRILVGAFSGMILAGLLTLQHKRERVNKLTLDNIRDMEPNHEAMGQNEQAERDFAKAKELGDEGS